MGWLWAGVGSSNTEHSLGIMGSVLSRRESTGDDAGEIGLAEEEVDSLAVATSFTRSEVRQLWRSFHKLDVDGSGHLSQAELMTLPQLAFNPLGERVVEASFERRSEQRAKADRCASVLGSAKDLLSTGTGGAAAAASQDLDFADFVHALAPFAPGALGDTKLRLAFRAYDFDGDSFLSRTDLTMLMKRLLPEDAEEDLIKHVVDRTLEEADMDGDEQLSYDEFRSVVANSDLKAKLTILFA